MKTHSRQAPAPCNSWPFAPLEPASADLVMADPGWSFKTYSDKGLAKSAQAQYQCMTLADIKALPVRALAAKDAILFLWATAPMLPQAFEVMAAWGFKYSSMGVWHKRTRHGRTQFGTGFRMRSACEPFLIGTVGSPKTSRSHRNLIEGLCREHSRKPSEAYSWAETYMKDARRVELFSRETRPGWAVWGNEVDKFSVGHAA